MGEEIPGELLKPVDLTHGQAPLSTSERDRHDIRAVRPSHQGQPLEIGREKCPPE